MGENTQPSQGEMTLEEGRAAAVNGGYRNITFDGDPERQQLEAELLAETGEVVNAVDDTANTEEEIIMAEQNAQNTQEKGFFDAITDHPVKAAACVAGAAAIGAAVHHFATSDSGADTAMNALGDMASGLGGSCI